MLAVVGKEIYPGYKNLFTDCNPCLLWSAKNINEVSPWKALLFHMQQFHIENAGIQKLNAAFKRNWRDKDSGQNLEI